MSDQQASIDLPSGPLVALGLDQMRRSDVLLLFLVLAIAILVRLLFVTQPIVDVFSWRQTSTAMIAENIPKNGWNIFFPEVDWTGPGPSYQGREFQLLTLFAAALNAVFGWHDWTGRAVAVAFSLITVFSLHRLTALIWDELHAHVVVLVYALLPAAIMIDTSYLPDPAMLALVTLGTWLFLRYFQGESALLLVVATATFTLGVLCKLPGIAIGLVPAWLTVVLLARGERRRALMSIAAMLVSLLLIIGYYAWAIYLGNSYPPFHVAGSGYIWDEGVAVFLRELFWLEDFWEIATWWFYGRAFLAVLLVGLWFYSASIRNDRNTVLNSVAPVWLVACVIIYLAAARQISNNPWNLHIFSIPFALFAGHGLIFLLQAGGITVYSRMGLFRVLLAVGVLVIGTTIPLMQTMKNPMSEEARLLGMALKDLTEPDDLVIAVSPDVGDPVAIYYSRNRGWVFPPGGGQTTWSNFFDDDATAIAELEELRLQGARWFGYTKNAKDDMGRYFVDHHAGFIDWLETNREKIEETRDFVIYRLPKAPDRELETYPAAP
jgi:hypothetical protein